MKKRAGGRMRAIVATSLILLAGMLVCSLAHAEDPSDAKAWDFQLAPFYLWAVNLDGDVTVRGITAPLKLDFDDIFDNLEAAFTAHFEASHKQTWGFFADFSYSKIGDEQTTPATTLDVHFEMVLAELGIFSRVFSKGPHSLEALGGFRYTGLDFKIDIEGPPPTVRRDQDWMDLIVGARYRWDISDKWAVRVRGDIGGFDLGSSSDFTWNLVGLIEFQPWKHVSFLGGYRALDVDYDRGSGPNKFEYDVLTHGPLVGFNIIW